MLSFNSSNIVSKTRTIGRRMFLVSSFKAIVVVGILGRLAALQINQFQKYSGLSDKNRFRETQIAPPRGIIQDYFGKEIASNEKIYQLHITPEDVPNIDTLFFKLKNIINLTEEKVFLLKRRMAKQKRWDTLIIADNLTWSEFSRVNLFLHELSGLRPVVSIARVYSDNASAHVVGYVSEVTPRDLKNKTYLQDLRIKEVAVGKTGLESLYDQQMFGTPGYLRFEVNAYGKKIKQVSTNNGEKGKTYRTTLDQDIQVHAADLIKDVSGAVCVMDIYNGDIVSMVSSPAFNPNAFVHGIDEQNWKDLISHRDKPLLNKAISGLYPPGSTIKTLTALCALENDVFTTKLNVECTGYIELYGERFHCWKKEGHGMVNMRKGIKHSCDVYFYEVARRLGIDRLAVTAKKFGLGEKVLKGFAEEKAGVVPGTKWKLNQLGKNWYLGETLHSGIGQGYFLTTPLQLCLMTAQIANGGYKLNPRIVINDDEDKNPLSDFLKFRNENPNDSASIDDQLKRFNLEPLFRNQENINFIKESMFAASNEPGGTSYGSRHNEKKFIFAGKTGSSQIKRFAQEQTKQIVKGMLTGPITILQWSFVRDDQPRKYTAQEIGFAIRDEVEDLEKNGIRMIQIDEPALREGLPLKRKDWKEYLNWSVDCFKISAAVVKNETQIHTHMCYAEFEDIIDSIAALDADVISIETSRSRMELLTTFEKFKYPNEIGPGVYDIHSPRVPSADEMKQLIQKASKLIDPTRIWVNPDCGLKTRAWPETIDALSKMVLAAKELRKI